MSELEAERARRTKTNKAEVSKQKEPRASTTDAQARSIKMADGGFRPAYNLQIVSAPASQVVVAVDLDTTGSDRGLARRGLERLASCGIKPADYLVDGGFTKNEDIEWADAGGVKLWCPAIHNKHRTDPYAARSEDGPGVADWRRRMPSERGIVLYKERCKAECPNAGRAAWGSLGGWCGASKRSTPCCCGSRSRTTCCAPLPCASKRPGLPPKPRTAPEKAPDIGTFMPTRLNRRCHRRPTIVPVGSYTPCLPRISSPTARRSHRLSGAERAKGSPKNEGRGTSEMPFGPLVTGDQFNNTIRMISPKPRVTIAR
jgi:hypothetical protein